MTRARLIAGLLCLSALPARAAGSDTPPETVLVLIDAEAFPERGALLPAAVVTELRARAGAVVVRPDAPVPPAVRARKQLERGLDFLARADAHFEALEMEAARGLYRQALAQIERATPWLADLGPLRRALGMLGATELLLDNNRVGSTLLERLLVLEPEFHGDPEVFNPRMQTKLDALADALASQPPHTLTIDTRPAGAAVFVDDRWMGLAPATVGALAPGRHYVRVEFEGRQSVVRALAVKGKKPQKATVRLPPLKRPAPQDAWVRAGLAASELAPEIAELATARQATFVLLLGAIEGVPTLVRYRTDGTDRQVTSAPDPYDDPAGAQRVAKSLLAFSGAAPASQADDTGAPADTQETPASSPQPPEETGTSLQGAHTETPPGPPPDEAGAPVRDEERQAEVATTQPTTTAPNADNAPPAATPAPAPEPTTTAVDAGGTNAATETPSAGIGAALAPAPSSSPAASASSGASWAFGAAATLAVAGGAFGYLAWREAQSYSAERLSTGGIFDPSATTDQLEGASVADRGRRFALIADVSFGLALASAITGLVLQLRAAPGSTAATAATTDVAVGPGSFALRF